MRKLALRDEILLSIEKPARYIGNEVNAVMKSRDVDISFAMCFPDVYEIGMSHLGIQILYDMFNKREDTWCERVYSPWTDLDAVMRKEHIPLFALESQDPIKDFDFLGITIQYEMCYTNILQILDLSGIPMMAVDRTWDDPIVILSPLPISLIFSISEKAKSFTMNCWNFSKKQKRKAGAVKSFSIRHPILPVFMFRLFIKYLITRTVPLQPLNRFMMMYRKPLKNRSLWM